MPLDKCKYSLCRGKGLSLTKGDNDGAGDAVGHDHSEYTHHPRISSPKLELVGLVLQGRSETCFYPEQGIRCPALGKPQNAQLPPQRLQPWVQAIILPSATTYSLDVSPFSG